MRSQFLIFLIFITTASFGQATLQQSLPEELFSEGLDMMSKSEFGSARQYFERYLETNETKYKERAEYNIAKCALNLYHLDGETLINKYIEDYPSSQSALMAHFELGNYFFQDKSFKKAVEHFKEVNPTVLDKQQKQELAYKLGYSYFSQRNFDQALPQFNGLKSKKGKYQILSSYYAGFIEFNTNEYDAAIEDLKRAAVDPNFKNSVTLMLASVYYKKGDYEALIQYVEPLMDSDGVISKNSQVAIFLAEAYFYTHQFKKAISYYKKGSSKLNAETAYNYAVCLSSISNYTEAASLLKNIAGNTTDTEIAASYLLGNVYLNQNKKLYALGAFLQIEHVENKEIAEEAKYLAARLSFQLGRTTQSIELLQQFSSEYPTSVHAEQASHLLAKALVQTNDYQAAITYIESLPAIKGEVKKAYQKATYLLGVEQYNKRKFRLAVANFEKSINNGIDEFFKAKAELYTAEAYSLGRKYAKAEPYYKRVINSRLQPKSDEMLLARFGLGYALYNQEKYSEALQQFNTFINLADKKDAKYGKALVRLADCEYVSKKYALALAHYTQAVNGVFREKDYAYYQIGVIYHIQSKYEEAIAKLNRVITYKSSPYVDDAIFEKAAVYLEMGSYDLAINSFSKLIAEHPRSKYLPYSLEKRALANFNRKQYKSTIADYELFLKKYPYHPSVQNVLLGLQQAYSLDGRSVDFNNTLTRFKNANPDIEGLEGVEFDAIRGYYNDGLYAKAEEGFKGFISNYPDDPNVAEATFILAESLLRQQKLKEALKFYYQVVKNDDYDQMHKVYERIADLEFDANKYSIAIKYFHQLNKNAVSANQQYRAINGLMKSHYFNGRHDSVHVFAKQLLNSDGVRNEFLVSAHLFEGKAYFAVGDYENAAINLTQTTTIANDENGAEAQYLLGEIKHLSKDYDGSNEVLYMVPQKYGNYTEWLDKSFLLIADNFAGKKEYFQAKATLESIIENTTSRLTKAQAEQRLNDLLVLEKGTKLGTDTIQVIIKDSMPDE
ncbi:MAG: tetratricopeptide repeat protein [Cyclobacteriaceae bacterium]|nr:tetratricopeptide repeat protein [Cyclobacteriaceae bacterium]